MRNTLIATGVFVGATYIGVFGDIYELSLLGWSGIFVVPIIAGVSAAQNPHNSSVSIMPILSPEYKGITARYFF